MKKFLIIILTAFLAHISYAAKVEYSENGILTYTESTASGEIKIIFRKCMNNNLFTFYNVFLNDKLVNSSQYSDNIGPFQAGGAWVGGDHNTPQGGPKPSANTVSVNISVDGKILDTGDKADGVSVLSIEVGNEIFYPDDKKFADENMTYIVSGNSIEVRGAHHFQYPSPMSVVRYYGAQSMFPATEVLLPGVADNKWISLVGKKEIDVMKSDAPNFSTYIEKCIDGYQAVLKFRDGMGDTSFIPANGEVYLFRNYGGATGKSYHVMMWNHTVSNGDRTNWHGLYTWFDNPIVDSFRDGSENPKFIYESYINGKSTDITIISDGKSTEPTTSINEPTSACDMIFAHASAGRITIDANTPDAVCLDLTGRIIYRGSGTFRCPKGVYIVNDMHGRTAKIIVK